MPIFVNMVIFVSINTSIDVFHHSTTISLSLKPKNTFKCALFNVVSAVGGVEVVG